MSVWLAALMGLVQGLTEFLPVSSSGHLVLIQSLLATDVENNYILFDVLLHLGTLVSVFICYWQDIKELIVEFFSLIRDIANGKPNINKNPTRRMIIMLLIATAPMVTVPLFNDYIESTFTSTLFVGFMLIITAVLLVWADISERKRKNASNASWLDALIVGIAQLVAVVPGISRSGSAISSGMVRGFDRQFAVKFSFLMSIPVIIGANIFSIADAAKESFDISMLLPYTVGIIVAMISGIAAIRFVKNLARKCNFKPFAIYCSAVGLIIVILSLIF